MSTVFVGYDLCEPGTGRVMERFREFVPPQSEREAARAAFQRAAYRGLDPFLAFGFPKRERREAPTWPTPGYGAGSARVPPHDGTEIYGPDEDLPLEDAAPEIETIVLPTLTIAAMGCFPESAKQLQREIPVAYIRGDALAVSEVEYPIGSGKYLTLLSGEFQGDRFSPDNKIEARFQSTVTAFFGKFQKKIEARVAADADPEPPPEGYRCIANKPVTFGIWISAVPASNPRGYAYRARDFIKGEEEVSPVIAAADEMVATMMQRRRLQGPWAATALLTDRRGGR